MSNQLLEVIKENFSRPEESLSATSLQYPGGGSIPRMFVGFVTLEREKKIEKEIITYDPWAGGHGLGTTLVGCDDEPCTTSAAVQLRQTTTHEH